MALRVMVVGVAASPVRMWRLVMEVGSYDRVWKKAEVELKVFRSLESYENWSWG